MTPRRRPGSELMAIGSRPGDRGEVGIWRRDGDHWTDILPWTPSEAVHPGSDANELEAWASGDRLTLVINGVQVASKRDSALGAGGLGVFAGGDGNSVVLERLAIRQLPSAAPPPVATAAPTPIPTPTPR